MNKTKRFGLGEPLRAAELRHLPSCLDAIGTVKPMAQLRRGFVGARGCERCTAAVDCVWQIMYDTQRVPLILVLRNTVKKVLASRGSSF